MIWTKKERQTGVKTKEEYSATASAVITVTEQLAYVFAVALLIVFPLVLTLVKGRQGAIVSGVVLFFTLPITVSILKSVKTVSFARFVEAVRQLFSLTAFQLLVASLLNVGVILKVGLQTLIPVFVLLAVFIGAIVVSFLIIQIWISGKTINNSLFIAVGLVPLFMNLLLLINFLFSHTPTVERYHFTKGIQRVQTSSGYLNHSSSLQNTTTINLDQDQYEEYLGIRIFLDYDQVKNATYVSYAFQEGLLGIPVVTEYKFE